MKNTLPLVSIVIPVYNGSNYMRDAIDSALAQVYENIEVIVVNDGSNDNGKTEEIALSYGDRIRYFYKENGGVASALNYGIEKMRGEYFSWLSHDDMYTPNKVSKQVDVLQQYDGRAIVFSDYYTFSHPGPAVPHAISKNAVNSVRCLLAIDTVNTLNGCSLLVPKKMFDELGYFDTELKITQDYDRWFCFAHHVPFVHINEPLIISRQHEEQDSRKMPILATEESDIVKSRFISELTDDEIHEFFEGSIGAAINEFNIYKNAGFIKTSIKLLGYICRQGSRLDASNNITSILNQSIFNCSNEKDVLSHLSNDVYSLMRKQCMKEKRKKRLLVYSNVWIFGGIQRVIATLLNSLCEKYEIVLVYTDLLEPDGFELDDRIIQILINDNNESISYRLAALSSILGIDLFIGNPNFVEGLLDIYKLLYELQIKSIACNHGNYFLPFLYKWLHPVISKRQHAYQFADAVTWNTIYAANIYSQTMNNSVYMPYPNTFDKRAEKLLAIDKTILCIARYSDSLKRVDRMLKVFSLVIKELPDSKLVLVGDYDFSMHIPEDSPVSIQQLLDDYNFPAESVNFVGKQDEIEPFYEKASLYLLTSESEGLPMVLNEGGVFGLPVVLFKIPGLEDVITDGENGFIVEQDDFEGMASSIIKLLANPELCHEMGKKAQVMAERFNKEVICQRWENLIDDVLYAQDAEALNAELSNKYMTLPTSTMDFLKQAVSEFETNIQSVFSSSQASTTNTNELDNSTDHTPVQSMTTYPSCIQNITGCTGCIQNIHNTFSWKVTRPLRWIRLIQRSLANNGLRITVKKIYKRFKNKLAPRRA